jgi:phosphonate transport system permease protein
VNGPVASSDVGIRIATRGPLLAFRWIWIGTIAGIIVAAFAATMGSDHLVNWGGWSLTWRFLRSALHPAGSADILQLTVVSTLSTVAFAVCGTALSIAIGAIGGILASEAWWDIASPRSRGTGRGVRWPSRVFRAAFAIPRGIHEVVWGLFLINVLGLDPLVAVLAIAIPFGAITAKVFAEMLDETPRAAALRLRASGASAPVAFGYGVLPRAIPLLISYALYRLECAIRSAAVLGLVGAGGLGYQIMLSLQSLRYEQVWTFLYALVVLIGVTDWGSSRLTGSLRGHSAASSAQLNSQMRSVGLAFVIAGVLAIACCWYLKLDLAKPFEPVRLEMLWRVLREGMPPRFLAKDLLGLAGLALETLAMSVVAITFAGSLSILVSWVATPVLFVSAREGLPHRRSVRRVLSSALATSVRGALIAARALSDGIWALIVLFMLFPGPLAGAVALGAYNLSVLGRLLAHVNETANVRSYWALRAQGASMGRAILYGLLPVMFPKYLAYILYRWEVCIRATVVVGIVGAGGLGYRLEQQLASFDYRGVTATLIFYIALTIFADVVSSAARRALRTE